MRLSVAYAVLLLFVSLPAARAFASTDDVLLDSAALADLETRAAHAEAKEQCYLYTELVRSYVEVAGKQLAAGESEQANASFKRIQFFADRIHDGLANKGAKRIKNAEMLLHLAAFHLSQCMHLISSDDAAALQATMRQLDKLHDEVLAQVFAH